jgi:Alw26I/Eco31I/Esp3I family type II restriction endonuclease
MGRKLDYGQGHPDFIEYTRFIAEHPNYEGMPDVYKDDGSIQWEAPSNRKSGKYKDTHQKRRDWWHRKAIEVGIDPDSSQWISRTAKLIHPTKRKPCKQCGRLLDIRYAYPTQRLLNRVMALDYVDENFPLDPLEHILELVARLVERYRERVFGNLPKVFAAGGIDIPELPAELDAWARWIEEGYLPREPKGILSPGAMSNAPDRFDGFHSLNLCHRGEVDPGRSKENLQSYTTDRRVFEYWVDGDWVAADRLMGLVRSAREMQAIDCLNGHPGPCSADHIGPISLGFAHRPEFQLLCRACNSAKNNRLMYSDVMRLRDAEREGESVASWHTKALWDLRKNDVVGTETALRLSKLLRDHRHNVMYILDRIAGAGHRTFLATLLNLEYSDRDVEFVNLRVENHLTRFDRMDNTPRTTKYALEQKARRFRVAFTALPDYVAKENRNAFLISTERIEVEISEALRIMDESPAEIKRLDREIADVLASEEIWSEERLQKLVSRIPAGTVPRNFVATRRSLEKVMRLIAEQLSSMWGHERYVRAVGDDLPADSA